MFDALREDIAAFRAHDPAATSTLSILLNSPGMRAIWAYRRQHRLWCSGHRLLARYLSTRSRRKFGVEIHPGATIGRRFLIDHGMGVVIGETTIIGDDCMVYQGVTLGGTGKESGKRHPTLGNDVTVGVGASVLGDITLGDGVKVGGGAVVVKDVPDHCTIVGVPGHVTTMCGVRLRTSRGARVHPAPCREGEACSVEEQGKMDPATIEKTINARENATRHHFLPDPINQTIDILAAQVAQLERRVAELEGQQPGEKTGD